MALAEVARERDHLEPRVSAAQVGEHRGRAVGAAVSTTITSTLSSGYWAASESTTLIAIAASSFMHGITNVTVGL